MSRFWGGLLCAVLLANCFPGSLHADGYARFKKMNEVSREMAKERNQEIIFYGKVEDLDESPVAGALVKMSVRIFGAMPPKSSFDKFEAVTDAEGCYTIIGLGELIGLESIAKEGHQYSVDYNPKRSLWATKPHKRKGPGFEPEKPMVFKVRKKDDPAFVLTGGGNINLNPGMEKLIDLYKREILPPEEMFYQEMIKSDWHTDIKVSAEEDGKGVRVIFESLDPDSGFVEATAKYMEELTEAPAQGYKKKLVIPIKDEHSKPFYAFVKNEGGLFYSRLSFRCKYLKDKNSVSIKTGILTNMVGNRGFEIDNQLYIQYWNDLRTTDRRSLKREQLRDGTIILPVLEERQ